MATWGWKRRMTGASRATNVPTPRAPLHRNAPMRCGLEVATFCFLARAPFSMIFPQSPWSRLCCLSDASQGDVLAARLNDFGAGMRRRINRSGIDVVLSLWLGTGAVQVASRSPWSWSPIHGAIARCSRNAHSDVHPSTRHRRFRLGSRFH